MKIILTLALISVASAYSTGHLVRNVTESVDLLFDAYRDVRLLLSTRQNLHTPQHLLFRNLQSLQNSFFNRVRPLRILIHGFWEDDTSDINTETSAELLRYYDFNIIFVDWSEGAGTINYFAAAGRVPTVGTFVASYLDFMSDNGMIDWSRTTVIGFSLGAHIAGHTGKRVRNGRIANIVGLDPAGPLFSHRDPAGRIDAGDGEYVECIHTSSPTLIIFGLGIGGPICDADYYPNGGASQPGCLMNTCDHLRAVSLYVESVASNQFHALQCPVRGDINSRRCIVQPGEWMGGDNQNFHKTGRGCFLLDTNRSSPFGQGQIRD
jgi:pancreatic triacylglycerol lipase